MLAAVLANNGGPTQTIALLAGSPAINAGDESVCSAPPVNNLDQRGYVRPGAPATSCSIGAYEYNAQPPVSTTTATATPTPTSPPSTTVTQTNTPTVTPMVTHTPAATVTPIACTGDCDGNGDVTVSEIITLVNMALGTQTQLSACPDGIPPSITNVSEVDIALIIQAVNNALNGCPASY